MIKMKLQAARSKYLSGLLSVAAGCMALTAGAQAAHDHGTALAAATGGVQNVTPAVVTAAPPTVVNGCRSYVDRTAPDADRTLNWDFDIEYDPERCIMIKAGQSITFDGDLDYHPIDALGGRSPSPLTGAHSINPQQSVFVFSTPGVYGYLCIFHDEMTGAIWVVE